MPLQVIIVGAGIAGLCTAISLRQAGCQVEIFEKSRFASEIGAALVVSPNGARVLERLGFSFARARACPVAAWDTMDGSTLSTLGSVDLSRAQRMFGGTAWTVHRVDLHTELLHLATTTDATTVSDAKGRDEGPPVRLRLNSEVVGATYDGVILLRDGTRHSADLVVAADGLHSVLRDVVVGEEQENSAKKPTHSSMAAFRFLVETDVLERDPVLGPLLATRRGKATMLVDTKDTEHERHIMWYACRGGETQNFVGIHPSSEYQIEEGEAAKSSMKAEFGHFDSHISSIIELAEHVKRWPLFVHEPYPTWVKGRVVLVGDAAHPMLPFGGQGSNMAMEDAGALGFLFQGLDEGRPELIGERLVLFEKVRKNRASRIQVLSKVRGGREKVVEDEVRQYADKPTDPIPTSLQERTLHDYSHDVFEACRRVLGRE